MMFLALPVYIRISGKLPVSGWKFCDRFSAHQLFRVFAVLLQCFDGDADESVLFGQLQKTRDTHHAPVLLHDLTAQATFLQSGQTHQIHRGFRMPRPLQDTPFTGTQRKAMAGPSEIFGTGILPDTGHGCHASLPCGNTGCRVFVINGDRKGSLMIITIFRCHWRQHQLIAICFTHRHTDQPPSVNRHKVYIRAVCEFGRTDKISLILSLFIIGYHNDMTLFQFLQSLSDRSKSIHLFSSFLPLQIRAHPPETLRKR